MNWNGWPMDPRVYTELSYDNKVRVINIVERYLGRPIIVGSDPDMLEVLAAATRFRNTRNKPVSAPPSPTHTAYVTHDDETPVTPDSYNVRPVGGRGGTRTQPRFARLSRVRVGANCGGIGSGRQDHALCAYM